MNDDALLPDHELASAYIDGELSEAERAQVESTPHLAALVAAFTKVRAKIADVSAPDPQARESAVAASLSQYDTLFGGASSPSAEESSANVLPLTGRLAGRQVWRGRWARPLLVAAAKRTADSSTRVPTGTRAWIRICPPSTEGKKFCPRNGTSAKLASTNAMKPATKMPR